LHFIQPKIIFFDGRKNREGGIQKKEPSSLKTPVEIKGVEPLTLPTQVSGCSDKLPGKKIPGIHLIYRVPVEIKGVEP
jgi:hypothetical protein